MATNGEWLTGRAALLATAEKNKSELQKKETFHLLSNRDSIAGETKLETDDKASILEKTENQLAMKKEESIDEERGKVNIAFPTFYPIVWNQKG